MDQIAPRSSRVMEVVEFVAKAEVDPVYLDASYYVIPVLAFRRQLFVAERTFVEELGLAPEDSRWRAIDSIGPLRGTRRSELVAGQESHRA